MKPNALSHLNFRYLSSIDEEDLESAHHRSGPSQMNQCSKQRYVLLDGEVEASYQDSPYVIFNAVNFSINIDGVRGRFHGNFSIIQLTNSEISELATPNSFSDFGVSFSIA